MNIYQVTLNLTFTTHTWDSNKYENEKLNKDQLKIKKKAFNRTDAYYIDHEPENEIKHWYDPKEMIEYVFFDMDIISEWDDDKFAIHTIVKTEKTKEELYGVLKRHSLEDLEYAKCRENGWKLYTLEPNNEACNDANDDDWVYGLVDYRKNPIVIKKLIPAPDS